MCALLEIKKETSSWSLMLSKLVAVIPQNHAYIFRHIFLTFSYFVPNLLYFKAYFKLFKMVGKSL